MRQNTGCFFDSQTQNAKYTKGASHTPAQKRSAKSTASPVKRASLNPPHFSMRPIKRSLKRDHAFEIKRTCTTFLIKNKKQNANAQTEMSWMHIEARDGGLDSILY